MGQWPPPWRKPSGDDNMPGEPLHTILYTDSKRIWEAIKSHPFVQELYRGTLPLEKYRYYVSQDYYFLVGMTRAFALLAAKTRDYGLARKALWMAYSDANIELENYEKHLEEIGLTLEQVQTIEPAPTTLAYVNHVLSTCSLGDPAECLVSTLPCFWTYMWLPEQLGDLIEENKNKIYREWIETYRSKEYRELTMNLIKTVDDIGRGYIDIERLKWIFKTSSRYEYMFWNMAYNMEKWPI